MLVEVRFINRRQEVAGSKIERALLILMLKAVILVNYVARKRNESISILRAMKGS